LDADFHIRSVSDLCIFIFEYWFLFAFWILSSCQCNSFVSISAELSWSVWLNITRLVDFYRHISVHSRKNLPVVRSKCGMQSKRRNASTFKQAVVAQKYAWGIFITVLDSGFSNR
jgi:hypothetical protein